MKERPSPRTSVRGDGLPASLRQCRQLKRQASLHRHCAAPKGLWQSVSPVQALRPASPVPRKLRGSSRGPQPPGRWGRIPKGTAFGIGSLWRFLFPVSFPLKETGSRRSAKSPRLVFGPTAAGDSPGVFRIRISPLRFVPLSRRLRRVTFFARPKKVTKEMRSRGPVQGRSP